MKRVIVVISFTLIAFVEELAVLDRLVAAPLMQARAAVKALPGRDLAPALAEGAQGYFCARPTEGR